MLPTSPSYIYRYVHARHLHRRPRSTAQVDSYPTLPRSRPATLRAQGATPSATPGLPRPAHAATSRDSGDAWTRDQPKLAARTAPCGITASAGAATSSRSPWVLNCLAASTRVTAPRATARVPVADATTHVAASGAAAHVTASGAPVCSAASVAAIRVAAPRHALPAPRRALARSRHGHMARHPSPRPAGRPTGCCTGAPSVHHATRGHPAQSNSHAARPPTTQPAGSPRHPAALTGLLPMRSPSSPHHLNHRYQPVLGLPATGRHLAAGARNATSLPSSPDRHGSPTDHPFPPPAGPFQWLHPLNPLQVRHSSSRR